MVMRNLVGVQAVDRDEQVLGSITNQFEEDGRTPAAIDAPVLKVDVPSESWLLEHIEYAKEQKPNRFGVPYMGKMTASYRGKHVWVPVSVLAGLRGQRNEQRSVRTEDLAAIKKIMQETSKLPLESNGQEYVPYIEVAYDGSAWVSEGNHRIMAASQLGWDSLPVDVRYFDGGERQPGPLHPGALAGLLNQGQKKLFVLEEFQRGFGDSKVVDENSKGAFSMTNFTDNEVMESLSGAVMRLNVDSRMVEVVRGDRVMSFGGAPALRHFSAEEKLSGNDYNRLLALDALGSKLGRLSASGTEVPMVDNGRFIGPMLVVKEGVALQDAGRGKLVGHDMSKLGTPLKPGDKLDVQYANGLVKAARNLTEELAKDGQRVSVAMHTR